MSILNNTTNLQSLLEQANSLPEASGGVELPTLSNEGTAGDLLSGKQLIDSDGNVVTGTIATKTSSNLTASGATVTVPAGYYASNASKSVNTATQATPSVNIDSAGKITASATQTAGYVSAGTKTGTKQLTTQAAKTVTPTESSQTAISSGVYTTGAVTVAGDSNLVAGNIKSGVSIFGVAGNYEGSGSGEGSGGDSTIKTSGTEFVIDSTSEGSVIYSQLVDGRITIQQVDLHFLYAYGGYIALMPDAIPLDTPIIILTSGTVNVEEQVGDCYTEQLASGTGYSVYNIYATTYEPEEGEIPELP